MNAFTGIKTLFGFGPRISGAVNAKPDGLLLHKSSIYSLFPLHVGMRQYWRDFQSLETWARSEPHKVWWRNFVRDVGGTGFWHETYFLRGGFEAIYDDVPAPLGLSGFAPNIPAQGAMFSSRKRLKIEGEAAIPSPVPEEEAVGRWQVSRDPEGPWRSARTNSAAGTGSHAAGRRSALDAPARARRPVLTSASGSWRRPGVANFRAPTEQGGSDGEGASRPQWARKIRGGNS